MINSGTIKNIFVSIKDKGRETRDQIQLDLEGIRGDKFYKKGLERSVLIASLDSYKLANDNGIEVKYGLLGENILVDFNPYALNAGDQLHIGEVILEITQNCTICNTLSKVDEKLPKLLKSDRGIFAKTIKSGKIKIGDSIKVVTN